ncbi:MAG TPA: hypothetical protein VK209_02895 [Candidatus Sulfotelmatobacter sp.]|nr:hypothetical protein [Candidatus Sulfotelmatobacter sp.]
MNADRVKRKLPSLLVNDSTTRREDWNSLMRYRYRFGQLKRRNPEKFSSLTNRVLVDLAELEKALIATNKRVTDNMHSERKRFER